jgi:hypothetical protein
MPRPVLHEQPAVRALFADLVRLGGYGRWNTERAAFLVRNPGGDVRCLLWPPTREFARERFEGRIPDGTIAIVHTHPEETPMGSPGDLRTAQTLGLPLFILTRNHIYQVTPDGKNEEVLQAAVWAARSATTARCSAPGPGATGTEQ